MGPFSPWAGQRWFVEHWVGHGWALTSLVFVYKRNSRSAMLLGAYTRPLGSGTEAVYGPEYVGRSQRCDFVLRVSNMNTLSARYSPNHKRSCESIEPRRAMTPSIGYQSPLPAFTSYPMTPPGPVCVTIHGFPFESTSELPAYAAAPLGTTPPSPCGLNTPSAFIVFGSTRRHPAKILPSGAREMNCADTPSTQETCSVLGSNLASCDSPFSLRMGNHTFPSSSVNTS